MVINGFETYKEALTEIQRLHEVEFVHAGCAGLREKDNAHLIAERDRAREECGHEKAMRASQREEMMRYFTDWQAAKKAIERVEALVGRWESEGVDRGPDDMLYTYGVAAMLSAALAGPPELEYPDLAYAVQKGGPNLDGPTLLTDEPTGDAMRWTKEDDK